MNYSLDSQWAKWESTFSVMFWCNVPRTVVDKAAKIITDPEDDEQDAAVGLLGLFDSSGDLYPKQKRIIRRSLDLC